MAPLSPRRDLMVSRPSGRSPPEASRCGPTLYVAAPRLRTADTGQAPPRRSRSASVPLLSIPHPFSLRPLPSSSNPLLPSARLYTRERAGVAGRIHARSFSRSFAKLNARQPPAPRSDHRPNFPVGPGADSGIPPGDPSCTPIREPRTPVNRLRHLLLLMDVAGAGASNIARRPTGGRGNEVDSMLRSDSRHVVVPSTPGGVPEH